MQSTCCANLLLIILLGFTFLSKINGKKVFCSEEKSAYCDCSLDCTKNPSFCDCEEAQICCGNENPSPSPAPPFTLVYTDGSGLFKKCKKVTQVFSVTICYTTKAWDKGDKKKIDHIAHVLAQLIDNNGDGFVDDPDLIDYIVKKNMHMFVPFNDNDSKQAPYPDKGEGQMTGLWEATLNSCSVPSNRGASDTDRSTWSSVVDNTPGSTKCNPKRDATVEEIHHLLAAGAAKFYPDKWGTTTSSKSGSLVMALNGNCGWGYTKNWVDPGGTKSKCTGTYAYDDKTCDENCIIIEGVYWASVSWIGGLFTTEYAREVGNEWLMTVPDSSMKALPETYSNARTLEEGAPELYKFISDTTSPGHLWLPSIMPNGIYKVGNISNPNPNPTKKPKKKKPKKKKPKKSKKKKKKNNRKNKKKK